MITKLICLLVVRRARLLPRLLVCVCGKQSKSVKRIDCKCHRLEARRTIGNTHRQLQSNPRRQQILVTGNRVVMVSRRRQTGTMNSRGVDPTFELAAHRGRLGTGLVLLSMGSTTGAVKEVHYCSPIIVSADRASQRRSNIVHLFDAQTTTGSTYESSRQLMALSRSLAPLLSFRKKGRWRRKITG